MSPRSSPTAVSRVNCGNRRRSLVVVSTRSKRIHCDDELVQRLLGLRIVEHPAGGFLDAFGVSSSPLAAPASSVVVRHRVPKRVGEPARPCVRLPLRIAGLFQAEQEMRRLQHRLDHQRGPVRKVLLLHEESFVPLQLGRLQRSAERLQSKAADELCAARRGGLAGNQASAAARAKRVPRQSLGGSAVRFHQQRRQACA